MAIIVDADVIIRGEKGLFDLPKWLTARQDDEFEIAAITVAELWHGVERAKGEQRIKRERYVQAVFSILPVVPYTNQTAFKHARLWADLQAEVK
jgi:tRNA(fMet)-specific endonuclease VapC